MLHLCVSFREVYHKVYLKIVLLYTNEKIGFVYMKDVIDSIKLRMCDVKTTPFIGVFLSAWIYNNSKLILIYFDKTMSVEQKIQILSWNDVNYYTPIAVAVVYITVYPLVAILFNAIRLFYKKISNIVENIIVGMTPLTIDESNDLRNKYRDLEAELNNKYKEVEEIKQRNEQVKKSLEKSYCSKEALLDETINARVENAIEDMKKNIDTLTYD